METKHLTAKEIEAVEKEAKYYDEYTSIRNDEIAFIHGAEFLAQLRVDEKPSEDSDKVANQLCDKYSLTIDYAPILADAYEMGRLGQRKPSEDLVDSIVNLFDEFSSEIYFNGMDEERTVYVHSDRYVVLATEIANLIPKQDVNAELLMCPRVAFEFGCWCSDNGYRLGGLTYDEMFKIFTSEFSRR